MSHFFNSKIIENYKFFYYTGEEKYKFLQEAALLKYKVVLVKQLLYPKRRNQS